MAMKEVWRGLVSGVEMKMSVARDYTDAAGVHRVDMKLEEARRVMFWLGPYEWWLNKRPAQRAYLFSMFAAGVSAASLALALWVWWLGANP